MFTFEKIKLDVKNQLAHIILSDPPSNYLTMQMLGELEEALDWLAAQLDLRAVILSASGASFCSGADFSEHNRVMVFSIVERFRAICRLLLNIECPTLAVVDGKIRNWGCDLLLCFDTVLAGDQATFRYDDLRAGTFPALAPLLLAERTGEKKLLRLLHEGAEFGTEQALELDFVSHAYPREELVQQLKKVLGSFTRYSQPIQKLFLKNMRRRRVHLMDAFADDIFTEYLNLLVEFRDYEEGIQAWTEKRAPQWKNE
ncbi:MAG: enoyl-CoA hydratase/isomerase family protein [Acidobacteria bacterium]|nr:enoyl-CoA hydratase/isomerase family protein [Acidobacteriota bacterium]